jgi:hypothetical protein
MAYSKQRQHVPFDGVAANRRRRTICCEHL